MVSEGSIPRSGLDPSDVFIADTGKELFVWIGGGASPDEKKNAMTYAHVSIISEKLYFSVFTHHTQHTHTNKDKRVVLA